MIYLESQYHNLFYNNNRILGIFFYITDHHLRLNKTLSTCLLIFNKNHKSTNRTMMTFKYNNKKLIMFL